MEGHAARSLQHIFSESAQHLKLACVILQTGCAALQMDLADLQMGHAFRQIVLVFSAFS
jgi:hypothetical protein